MNKQDKIYRQEDQQSQKLGENINKIGGCMAGLVTVGNRKGTDKQHWEQERAGAKCRCYRHAVNTNKIENQEERYKFLSPAAYQN